MHNGALSDHPTSRYRAATIIIPAALVSAVLLAIGQFAALARTDDLDTYLFSYYASRILSGQHLYSQLWDNKPPGIFWVDTLGLWLAGGSYVGVIVVCSLASLAANALFFLLAKRLYGLPTAAIGMILAAVFVLLHDYHVGSNRPSTFYVLFELCVMSLYLRSMEQEKPTGPTLFVAGLCAVAAVMFRQTAFSASATLVIHQCILTWTGKQSRARLWAVVSSFGAGILAMSAIVTVALLATSNLSYAWHGIVTSNLGYFTRPEKSELLPELYRWRDHLSVLGLPLILASAVYIDTVFTRCKRTDSASYGGGVPATLALVTVWFPIALYLALIGPSRRMLYFGVALAPLTLLATHAVWRLLRRPANENTPRFSVIVALVWIAYMLIPPVAHQIHSAQIAWFRRFDERVTPRHIATIEAIQRYTNLDDPIYVWGYRPGIYWYTQRPLAQRYIVTTLIEQGGPRAQPYIDLTIDELEANPPKVLVLNDADLKIIDDPPGSHPIDYGDFGDWVRKRYARPPEFKKADAWIRID